MEGEEDELVDSEWKDKGREGEREINGGKVRGERKVSQREEIRGERRGRK